MMDRSDRRVWWLMLGGVVLLCMGCGLMSRAGTLVGIESKGKSDVEPPPRRPADLDEAVRQMVAYGGDVLGWVEAQGIEAGSPGVGQAVRGTTGAGAVLGLPEAPLDVLLPEINPRADKAIDRLYAGLGDFRAERADWEADITKVAAEPVVRSWRLSSPLLALYLVIPGAAAGMAVLARKLWAARHALARVIPGIQAVREFLPRAQKQAVDRALLASTDEAAREAISKAKAVSNFHEEVAGIKERLTTTNTTITT